MAESIDYSVLNYYSTQLLLANIFILERQILREGVGRGEQERRVREKAGRYILGTCRYSMRLLSQS